MMNLSARRIVVSSFLVGALFSVGPATAAEQGKSIYLLGVTGSMAGVTPPPGTYVSSFTYVYSGDGTGAAALSVTLPGTGTALPGVATLEVDANVRVEANVALDVLSVLWVAPQQVLGGHFGVGALLPVGYQGVDVNVDARTALTFPDGTVLQGGKSRLISENTFAVGDPLATAFIGWSSGDWHWKVTGLLNIPVGEYDRYSLVNMGFNRWAADLTASTTWLDPKSGFEVSLAGGFTFNGENPDTDYRTGTEFHFEGAVMKHFSKDFALGVAGYHYQQVTGDSGAGAVLGPLKGRVSAIGPNLTYNFQVKDVPVLTSVRWLHEFDTENRLEGDAFFATLTIPFGGSPGH
ncbi:transporter [Xanthobacter oligotrophicus]|uniref:SphA family protein n=1 Tax=Xanthobacter oligotrophicus TaxID=2607286 RepID=UPI0011F11499|nr:transporter [Xanthobacter oligotrophicus]MCG5233828.1 transporter [Xanthobacter oligotrophicus]